MLLEPADGEVGPLVGALVTKSVGVESLVETVRRIEVAVGNNRSGGPSPIAEVFGQRRVLCRERAHRTIDAVPCRIRTGENGGKARAGLRSLAQRVCKQHPGLRQCVDVRRCVPRVPVTGKVVRPQRVHGQKENVPPVAGKHAGASSETGTRRVAKFFERARLGTHTTGIDVRRTDEPGRAVENRPHNDQGDSNRPPVGERQPLGRWRSACQPPGRQHKQKRQQQGSYNTHNRNRTAAQLHFGKNGRPGCGVQHEQQ